MWLNPSWRTRIENYNAILIAAAIIAAPRLGELKDTPALRYTVSESIRVAEFMLKMVKDRFP